MTYGFEANNVPVPEQFKNALRVLEALKSRQAAAEDVYNLATGSENLFARLTEPSIRLQNRHLTR
jgi:hypothetical protein